MQPVTLRRWEIAAAFVLLTAVFTFTGFWTAAASNRAHNAARKADAVASRNTALIGEIVANRRQTIARLHAQDVRSCRSRHRLVAILRQTLRGSIRDSRRLLAGPLGQGSTAAAIRGGLARSKSLLVDLGGADCTSVPRLGPIKPKKVRP